MRHGQKNIKFRHDSEPVLSTSLTLDSFTQLSVIVINWLSGTRTRSFTTTDTKAHHLGTILGQFHPPPFLTNCFSKIQLTNSHIHYVPHSCFPHISFLITQVTLFLELYSPNFYIHFFTSPSQKWCPVHRRSSLPQQH